MSIVVFDKIFKRKSTAQEKAAEMVSRFKSDMNISDALLPPDFEKKVAEVLYESETLREQYKDGHGSGN